jgi:hypothetical protein
MPADYTFTNQVLAEHTFRFPTLLLFTLLHYTTLLRIPLREYIINIARAQDATSIFTAAKEISEETSYNRSI